MPIAVTYARSDVMDSLKRGEHSNTFGGNPLACAACAAAIDALVEDGLVENASRIGERLKSGFEQLDSRLIREVRGIGLMLGVDLKFEAMDIILKSLDKGVIVLEAGKTVVRLLPPLVLSEQDATRVVSTVGNVIKDEERRRLGCA
jgi:acetylornithine/LysW-gamma-L-lysine aminotransferase